MGRRKHIETPEKLWDLFCAYEREVKNNPKLVQDYVGKDATPVYREKERPLTTEGFENYVADLGVITDLGDYFANTQGRYSDYSTICRAIKRKIRQDQIEGGMVSIYNPSITQRLNSLVERSESVVREQKLFGDDE